MSKSPATDRPPNRWAAFTDRELGALLGALEAADREGSLDEVGKALWAGLDTHFARLKGLPPAPTES